jgi:hypothetical protein
MDDHKKDSKKILHILAPITRHWNFQFAGSHTSISGVVVVKGAEESFPTIAICTRTLKDPK